MTQPHAERKHAKRSPSSLGSYAVCPPPSSTTTKRNWHDGSQVGAKFGRVTVVGAGEVYHSVPRGRRGTRVPCLCECGHRFWREAGNLVNTPDHSCGCVRAETLRRKFATHGRQPFDVYQIWTLMRNRCRNPHAHNWACYGGRGVSIHPEWNDFECFLRDMGPRPSPAHSLDRIDNGGDYTPANCRWATRTEQARNRRTTRHVSAFGTTQSLAAWAEQVGMLASTVAYRLSAGWTPEQALTKKPS